MVFKSWRPSLQAADTDDAADRDTDDGGERRRGYADRDDRQQQNKDEDLRLTSTDDDDEEGHDKRDRDLRREDRRPDREQVYFASIFNFQLISGGNLTITQKEPKLSTVFS